MHWLMLIFLTGSMTGPASVPVESEPACEAARAKVEQRFAGTGPLTVCVDMWDEQARLFDQQFREFFLNENKELK